MNPIKMVFPAGVAIILTIVAGSYMLGGGEAPAEIAVTRAWARATPPGASVGAVYLTIENKGGAPDRLIAVTSPAAGSAMLHQTVEESGVSRMREGDESIAPGATLDMRPGGAHIMLMGLKTPLTAGETVAVTLDFVNAGRMNVSAEIEPLGADPAAK